MLKLRMPVEHGVWGLLLVPLLSAVFVCGVWNEPVFLCMLAATALFLLRGSVDAHRASTHPAAPFWMVATMPAHLLLAAVAIYCGAVLILRDGRMQLLPLAAASGALYAFQLFVASRHKSRHEDAAQSEERIEKRSLPAELIGVLLLSLVIPALWIAARGELDRRCAELWLLNLAFFLGGVLYVKFRVRGLLAHRSFSGIAERARFAWPVFIYHAALLIFLLSLVWMRSLSAAILIAFLPAILRAGNLLFALGARFPIRRLGWTEVLNSVVFAALLIFALR